MADRTIHGPAWLPNSPSNKPSGNTKESVLGKKSGSKVTQVVESNTNRQPKLSKNPKIGAGDKDIENG